jgi:hypothetical protein
MLLLVLIAAAGAQAQLALGQYQDEAPLRTWNIFGPLTASQTAMGGTRYARAFDLSAAQTNASLLSRLPLFTVALSGSYLRSELFKFGPVNTGVLYGEENMAVDSISLDFGGIAVNYKGWGLAFTVSINELFERPSSGASIDELGQPIYSFVFLQDGFIRTYNLGFSRQITPRLAVGIGLNRESGWLERDTVENTLYRNITIEDAKRLDFKSSFINAGVTYDASEVITLALVLRTPYTRKADGASQVRNSTPPATDIRIEVEAESTYKQPLVLGVGADFAITERLRLAADASFFNWAPYEAVYFGEKRDRCLKNVVTLHTGLEYGQDFRLFDQDFRLPLWLGLAYDPQPVKCVDSKYYYITGGLGLRHRHFHLDVGGMLGWERGSGDDLRVYRVTATAGFRY